MLSSHTEYTLQRNFGISLDDYEELHRKQDGACAICGRRDQVLDIDHDHKTKEVRGLLCGNCNRGLGLFKDNTLLLASAIVYLER